MEGLAGGWSREGCGRGVIAWMGVGGCSAVRWGVIENGFIQYSLFTGQRAVAVSFTWVTEMEERISEWKRGLSMSGE